MLASREDPALRQSVLGLAGSTAVGAGLLFVAAATSGALQLAIWGLALLLDTGGPLLFGQDGWKLVPGHFAERHGADRDHRAGRVDRRDRRRREGEHRRGRRRRRPARRRRRGSACGGCTSTSRRSSPAGAWRKAAEGRERNGIARDSYSYLHFPMVAGIALIAVGLKRTIAHVDEPLKLVPAAALLGRRRAVPARARRVPPAQHAHAQRTAAGVRDRAAGAAAGPATTLPALATLAILAALLAALIAYEALRYADSRDRIRHQLAREPVAE